MLDKIKLLLLTLCLLYVNVNDKRMWAKNESKAFWDCFVFLARGLFVNYLESMALYAWDSCHDSLLFKRNV